MSEAELQISTQSPSQWGRVLSIAVPKARYTALRAEVARDIRKRVARPGFRKGHVPAAIVERDFAASIDEGALERLIPAACDQAIQREGLEPLSQPRVHNLVLDDPELVKFDLSLEVRPRFEVGPLDRLAGTRPVATITDAHVDQALTELREEHAQFIDVERAAQDGDMAVVGYVPLDEQGVERTDQKVENYPFRLGQGDIVAEFEAAVRGRSAGETARTAIAYPADHDDPALAGRNVEFQVEVRAVKEKRLPELDDDLAKEVGFEGLEALRDRVRTDLTRRLSEESQRHLQESLVDHLLQENVFEAPASMVEQYLEFALQDWEGRQSRLRMPPPDEAQRNEFRQAARPAAERAVRRTLLLEQLATQHEISASEEDVDKWIEERVLAGGSRGAEVRAFFAEPSRRRRLRSDLVEERIFEFLVGRANITEVTRTAEPGAGGQ